MNRKLLEIAAIAVAFLFLLMPVSAMSPIPTVKENTMISEILPVMKGPSIIPQSEFVITLNENEEVIWMADSVVRDDDIAYITMETITPQPLGIWLFFGSVITAENWWGRPLFYAFAKAWARFNWQGKCNYIIDRSNYHTLCWRYDRVDFDSYTYGDNGDDYAKVTVDAYFRDCLIRRNPHIHVWARSDMVPYGGGYLEWDS